MSGPSIEEKLARPATTEGRATRSLSSLERAGAYVILSGSPKAPTLVRINPMDTPSNWVRRGDGQYERTGGEE